VRCFPAEAWPEENPMIAYFACEQQLANERKTPPRQRLPQFGASSKASVILKPTMW
jgi:hypothetical protein